MPKFDGFLQCPPCPSSFYDDQHVCLRNSILTMNGRPMNHAEVKVLGLQLTQHGGNCLPRDVPAHLSRPKFRRDEEVLSRDTTCLDACRYHSMVSVDRRSVDCAVATPKSELDGPDAFATAQAARAQGDGRHGPAIPQRDWRRCSQLLGQNLLRRRKLCPAQLLAFLRALQAAESMNLLVLARITSRLGIHHLGTCQALA
mmetsp:Transcript_101053/g.182373  ORF Transcript_101053/g.182373 Transcript_101053/m.182373 type:complete len:200 (+) Transcript_101053:615-1214(+)